MDGEKESDFRLFSSLRFDTLLLQDPENSALAPRPCPFYMLSYHRDRMLRAAGYFNWPEAIASLSGPEGLQRLLEQLEAAIDIKSSTPLRVRTIVDHKGAIVVETFQAAHVPLANLFPAFIPSPGAAGVKSSPLAEDALVPQAQEAWTVVVDPMRTKPSPFTSYKTTRREIYTAARERVGIEAMEPREVLIISEKGEEIMEGSLTSVFFWRNGRWVTPPVSSGGQIGTSRRWLLEKRLCEEEVVTTQSLVNGEECWISNGVRGLSWGKIRL